ncbi:MAG TPA: PadR family transcriptional regulator [Streptosporangiaceae bacterium]|nr:PadR family transcriptional regulator [Streptosporangiaceae bacterium]
MPLHHAVLALLADKPAHGYELKISFEQAVGDQWGGLNIGHLYQILDRLSRDQLIESERQPQPVKPDRVVHHLTPAGRAELDRWLNEPSTRLRGYRDDFFLKLVAAVQAADPETLEGVLRRQRAHLLRELHSLAEARREAPSSVVELLITAAELHIRADLGVVDAAEKRLEPELADMKKSPQNSRRAGAAAAGADPAAAGTAASASRADSAAS